jgi:hypothetical protein
MRPTLSFLLIILVLIAIGMAIALALGIGIGWILSILLPFSLFEGSVLGLITVLIVGYRVLKFLAVPSPFVNDSMDPFELDTDGVDIDEWYVPAERFIPKQGRPTWAHWYQFIFANEIYDLLDHGGGDLAHMNHSQRTELSIRLAEMAVSVLQAKPPSTRRLNITEVQLQRAFVKAGQQPYTASIMETAHGAIEVVLDLYDDGILEVIQEKAWRKPSPMFD